MCEGLLVCVCVACKETTLGCQKWVLDPQELEIPMIFVCPLPEWQELLSVEPSLQPRDFFFITLLK